MSSPRITATGVQTGAIAHVAFLWLAYLGVNKGANHGLVIAWIVLGILWFLVWPAVILIWFRQIGALVTLMCSAIAWALLATPIAFYLTWAHNGFH
jgi:hypothetical protein